jgi:hypothetical protein
MREFISLMRFFAMRMGACLGAGGLRGRITWSDIEGYMVVVEELRRGGEGIWGRGTLLRAEFFRPSLERIGWYYSFSRTSLHTHTVHMSSRRQPISSRCIPGLTSTSPSTIKYTCLQNPSKNPRITESAEPDQITKQENKQ